MKRFALLLSLALSSFAIYKSRYLFFAKKTMVNAKVTIMTYNPIRIYSINTYNPHTKSIAIKHLIQPAGYWVTVEYNGYSETLDDRNLYESVKKGDMIQMILWQKYDAKGNLMKQALKLPQK